MKKKLNFGQFNVAQLHLEESFIGLTCKNGKTTRVTFSLPSGLSIYNATIKCRKADGYLILNLFGKNGKVIASGGFSLIELPSEAFVVKVRARGKREARVRAERRRMTRKVLAGA